jgi:hypothetical protein
MPGSIPGIPGIIAFAGVKFGGYCLAGWYLKKLQPAIEAKAISIAGARTGLGILIGPPLTIGLTAILASTNASSTSNSPLIGVYAFIYMLRILIWALVIYLFTKKIGLPKSDLWTYSAVGGIWSCLLDLPGIGLAVITPGQVPFC